MSIKAILFDFDDTLGDRETYTHRTYCGKMDEILPDMDPWYREAVIQQCLIYDQHGDVPKRYIRDMILEKFGIDFGEDFQDYWRIHQPMNVVLYEDAVDTILELKKRGYKVGILTNGESHSQRSKVVSTGLIDLVDALTISGETDTRKPEPEIFRLTAEKLGLKPEECAFVGDMFKNDVYGAHRAGMLPIWIWPHSVRRFTEVDVLRIQHLSELLDLFQ